MITVHVEVDADGRGTIFYPQEYIDEKVAPLKETINTLEEANIKLYSRMVRLERLCKEFADTPHYHYESGADDDEGCDLCLYCGNLDWKGHSPECPVTQWKEEKERKVL